MDLLIRKFIRILRVELEDLQSHIERLEGSTEQLRRERTASERVLRENLAVFGSEKCGVTHFMAILEGLDLEAFENVDAAAAHVKDLFRAEIDAGGFARACYVFTERKIDKVLAYVRDQG